ncbi:MAG: NADH-quinone oxidoreductase subunit NuoH [Candidatus Bathyarchaeia archaeon]
MILEELLKWILSNWGALAQVVLLPGVAFVLLFTVVAIWFERKYLARSMLRIGPLHTGRVAGWLQIIADFIKLTGKESITPEDADGTLFNVLPILSVGVSAVAMAFIPFSRDWIIYNGGGISLLLFLGVTSLVLYLPLMMGWTSNNKYTMIGSLRMAYLYISAEIPLFSSAMGVAILAGSFDLVSIVEAQSRVWFILPQLLGFLVFFVAFLAEVERVPFDIPVAEQEIVAGWRTEYGGINLGIAMMMDYVPLCAWTLLLVTLYLGGYQGPILFGSQLLSNFFWIMFKFGVVVAIVLLLRSVFPRLRIDQTLRLSWCYLTPMAFINLLLTAFVTSFFPGLLNIAGVP